MAGVLLQAWPGPASPRQGVASNGYLYTEVAAYLLNSTDLGLVDLAYSCATSGAVSEGRCAFTTPQNESQSVPVPTLLQQVGAL